MKIVARLVAAAILSGTVAAIPPAAAQVTYSNTYNRPISFFGAAAGSSPIYGQVFTAPGGTLSSWTFYNSITATAGETFAIAAWNGTTVTGADLFSAGSNTVAVEGVHVGSIFYAHTVSGIDLALTPGQSYFAYYTTYNTASPVSGVAFEAASASPLGGSFQYSNSAGSPAGASYLFDLTFYPDLRYSATFAPALSAVPEPTIWAMMIAGFGAFGVAMRRTGRLSGERPDIGIGRIAAGGIS